MTMNAGLKDDLGRLALALSTFLVIVVLGMMMGATIEKGIWETRIVDEPEVIAVIKSRILAERNEREVRSGQ